MIRAVSCQRMRHTEKFLRTRSVGCLEGQDLCYSLGAYILRPINKYCTKRLQPFLSNFEKKKRSIKGLNYDLAV